MISRILLLLKTKVCSLFLRSIAIRARVEYSHVSHKAKVWRGCVLNHASVDDYSYVGPDTRLIHAHIGKFCSIASDCAIGMGVHTLDYLSTSPLFTSANNGIGRQWTKDTNYDEYKTIVIGNDVWIGSRVMVLGGVKIGDGAIIGAGAVVTKDVPPYTIVAGLPAKIVRKRFSESMIDQLLKLQWWNLPDKVLLSKIEFFQKPMSEDIIEKLMSSLGGGRFYVIPCIVRTLRSCTYINNCEERRGVA